MLKPLVQVLSAVATGAAVVEGASLVLRGARVATKAASDRLAGTEFTMSATAQNEADRKAAKSKQHRKETRQVAKESRKRAQKVESRLRKGAKLASGEAGLPQARPASRQAARQAQVGRRMRQLSAALEKKSDEALSRDQDLADALMEQAAAVAQIAENPPVSPSAISDPIVAQLVDALTRSGGDDVQRMASDLAERRVPNPVEYGVEAEDDAIFDVVMGWSDEDPDAIGSHCQCGSGGVCGCSLAGHDDAQVSLSPASKKVLEESADDVVQGGWDALPDFARPFGFRTTDSISGPSRSGGPVWSGGCKTGMCNVLPK